MPVHLLAELGIDVISSHCSLSFTQHRCYAKKVVCLLIPDLRLRLHMTGMRRAYQPVVDVADGMLSYG